MRTVSTADGETCWGGPLPSVTPVPHERSGWKLDGGGRRREFLGSAFAEVRYRTDLARAAS
jgi:hypothetical protein